MLVISSLLLNTRGGKGEVQGSTPWGVMGRAAQTKDACPVEAGVLA